MNTISSPRTASFPAPVASSEAAARQSATDMLEKGRVQQAIDLLEKRQGPQSEETHQLLGGAYYRQGDFDHAARHFEAALTQDPKNQDLADMLAQTRNNQTSGATLDLVQNPFSKDKLLAAPHPGPGVNGSASRPPARTLLNMAMQAVNHVGGGLAGAVMGILSRVFGAKDQGEVWTTWSKKNMVEGALMLAHMRDQLDHHNLYDQYKAEGQLTGFETRGLQAPQWTKYYRTADGSWNNPENPKEGAAGTRFGRNVPLEVTKPDEANLMNPSPREVSRVLMTRDEGFKEVPFLNMLAAAWIQFMVHDWVSHGDVKYGSGVMEVPLAPDDPMRKKYHESAMMVPKTAADPTRRPEEAGMAPGYINENTSWWDGSQIYGSDVDTQNRLRSHQDGKLRLQDDGRLPLDHGVEDTGFRRNWWLGLDLLHNTFAKEHNSVCDMLKEHHPDWNDEKLFQTSRLIVAAEMAKIHTVEWTPAILPNKTLTMAMNANWYGLANYEASNLKERKILNHWKPDDHMVGGIVGNHTAKFDVPYSLTEEFTAVYRMHSLLPDEIKLHHIGSDKTQEVALGATRNKAVHDITEKNGLTDLIYSFGVEHPGQLVMNNYPKTLQELTIPGFSNYDLAAVDVLRDRERGIPRYNEFRRQIGLVPIKKFEDLTDDPKQVEKLKKVYGNDVEKLDMLIGTLAEAHRPENFGFGETLFQIFIVNASRRLQADRFFTTSYNEETYTKEGLEWIDRSNMKSILLRQYPDLAKTNLSNVNNAFEPWDPDTSDPSRHPLEQYHR
ncbi:MAG TPA: peroxidase family protein [Candidatus Xenobia bacterium]